MYIYLITVKSWVIMYKWQSFLNILHQAQINQHMYCSSLVKLNGLNILILTLTY